MLALKSDSESIMTAPRPKYSICITNYNQGETIRESLESIVAQIDDSFEIVVVDSLSTDDSARVLSEYASKGTIKLISKKCNRGKGRQIAFENSVGEYVLAHFDMDIYYNPKLIELLQVYHRKYDGLLLRFDNLRDEGVASLMVAPRTLLTAIGGWRELQVGEDWELWRRAWEQRAYRWTEVDLGRNMRDREGKGRLRTYRDGMNGLRDSYVIGRPIHANMPILGPTGANLIARVLSIGTKRYLSDVQFKPASDAFRVPLE
jgi:glycosyltransferase involved in cell wall biosynthesis